MSHTKFHALLLSANDSLAEQLLPAVRLGGGKLNVAASFADALRLLQGEPADLMLLNLDAAEADCLDLLRQIKRHRFSLPVFTIALSSNRQTGAVLRAFELGLNEFIALPFDSHQLCAQLQAATHLKRQLEELTLSQQELAEASRTAEANSRAKSEFLAAMSHEIRTPMNGVIAMTGLLRETPLTADQLSYVETIHNSSELLLNILNDILDFSKIEAGKMELEKQAFDLRLGVEAALDLLATRAQEKSLELGYAAEASIPTLVEGDVQRLNQVLVNLLSNAIKFTERGDVFVKVWKVHTPVSENESGTLLRLHFTVRDTGIGIASDRLARLFQAFTQAEASTSRNYGGTGLGLAISRRLVEMMGGRMWAESVPGQGSTFHFTINLHTVPNSPPPPYAGCLPRLANRKILILNDNGTSRLALFELCQRWGMLPTAVENVAQAMELLRHRVAFDLALVDLHLPGMDDVAVAAEIQKFPVASTLPIVLMASPGKATSPTPDGRRLFSHVCNKPVKPSQLSAALENALDKPLPAAPPAAPQKTDQPLAARLPLRILVVDDNVINQKVSVRLLQQLGYQSTVAANGREALEALDQKGFDFIFMDVMMPEIDGLEATRQIRERQLSGKHPNYAGRVIIVAMTAHAMQSDRENCLAAGMDDYLAKPVRPKDVRDMIEKWGGTLSAPPVPTSSATPLAVSEMPPVDMGRMKDLTDGNMEGMRELVEMYLKQTFKQMAQLKSAIRDQQSESVRHLAHSSAGANATLGMGQMHTILRALEKLGGSGVLTDADRIYADGLREFLRVQEYLRAQPELAETVARCLTHEKNSNH